MSGPTIDSSMPFDPYANPFGASQLQTFSDFSPASIFDTEDFDAEFTSNSASPSSPRSPALSASSFGFQTTDPWTAWDSELSPEPDTLFGCPPLACPPSKLSLSPVVNPMDLAVPPLSPQQAYFQSPQVMLATMPSLPQQQQAAPPTASLPTPPPTKDDAAKRYPSRSLKRKSTSGPSADEPAAKAAAVSPPPATPTATTTTRRASAAKAKDSAPKKTAHNMIEKRYRTNLNDKIAQLRDAVPALRQVVQRNRLAESGGVADGAAADDARGADIGNGGFGAGSVAKLNKATILSKATEYIVQLERRVHGLETENNALRGRMEGLEVLLMGRGAAAVGPVGIAGGWS